ncbi:LysR family transcriptional regulator [Nocardia abscessus]|uniref:LysR family transcriptional regulator n=1 Tax=Nocardia TaxID=1817 RepID=UPI00189337A4|nr:MULTISPECIES: LysR substrate-binding domain-containing protein [Nocardia]MBF6217906.1 LysR family transcriptional regulator [Nocardia abscessus]MDE1668315.1 LysR substrate-binding domain-containing protein [Nocardia gipuzkoensis]
MSRLESIDVVRLRWFVVVAQELHFARAAKSLHISRQKLSHTVIDLENELGTKLFVPGAQPTQLTDDGQAVLEQAREIISRSESSGGQEQPDGSAGLRVGFVPGVTVSKWTRIWGERFPETSLEVIALTQADQEAALREGRVDMCFVRLPIDREGVSAIPLYREVPVVVVQKEHPLSVFDEVRMGDLTDERLQDTADVDAIAAALELVAAAGGAAIVPHSLARLHHRRDLVYRPMLDVPDTEVALAWRTGHTTDLVEDFIGVVRGRSERSSRAPVRGADENQPRKKSPAKKTSGRPAPAKKKPARRRGR